jgi:hypothetical protein
MIIELSFLNFIFGFGVSEIDNIFFKSTGEASVQDGCSACLTSIISKQKTRKPSFLVKRCAKS